MLRSSPLIVVYLAFFAAALPVAATDHAHDIAVIDRALERAKPSDPWVKFGDVGIKYSTLKTFRDRLARKESPRTEQNGPSPDSVTPGGAAFKWTGGNVYYRFDPTQVSNGTITEPKKQQVRDGVADWAAWANLHFNEITNVMGVAHYITVQEDSNLGSSGFSSSVGMDPNNAEQFVVFGPNAWNRGGVCHEMGHAIGLWHEHQRTDRDTYVVINWNNINQADQPNFVIISGSQTFGTAYDFYSVMHYARKTFSNNGQDSISMQPAYAQYIDIIGNVYDRTLGKIERAGMAAIYGNPTPLPSAVVTNTKDSGPGSLRTAIYYAFDRSTDPSPVATIVTFNIPVNDPNFSSGVFTIKPTAILPALGNGTTIDGTSQTAFTGDTNISGPEVALDGFNYIVLGAPPFNLFSPGLILRASNCTIKGLTIQNFNQWGIRLLQGSDPNGSATTGNLIGGATASARNVISGNAFYGIAIHDPTTTGNIIQGNYIGTNQTGTAAQANQAGIVIYLGAHGNTVSGNVLSGNTFQGIFIGDAGSNSNLVQGNFIGTNPTGSSAVPNLVGAEITNGAQSNVIGGTSGAATRNIISGNTVDGVQVHASGTQNNVIQGNYIGLAFNGTTALANGGEGVQLYGGASSTTIGGTTAGARNVISGNSGDGVIINASNGTTIQGNYIGTDFNGTTAKPNGVNGVYIWAGSQNTTVGGTTSAARNIISGNLNDGVDLNGAGNTTVQGNYVGLDVNGAGALGNHGAGVALFGNATTTTIGGVVAGARNIISSNAFDGVYVGGASNTLVQGNYIGLDVTGSLARGNSIGVEVLAGSQNNTIGGNVAAARNIIAASGAYDVAVQGPGTTGNVVLGNYIGLDVSGMSGFGMNNSGVAIFNGAQNNTIGGTTGGSRNFISGHGQYGLFIADTGTSGNQVQGNTIGLNVAASVVPNTGPGVGFFSSSQSNTIGGSGIGASNIISGNSNEGIAVYSFNTTTIRETFSRNSIYNNGGVGIALYNGGNNSQPAPSLSLAKLSPNSTNFGGTDVTGSLTAAASTQFTIEFFASPTGGDEGQFFVGSKTVTTNAGGSVNFTASLTAAISANDVVTATATDPNGNTSAFSNTQVVTSSTDTDNDAMPDNWENHYSLNPNVADPNLDSDGDGVTNYQEFRAGTDPKDPKNAFRITSITKTAGGDQVAFNSVSGKTYRLEYRDDWLLGSWLIMQDQISGTGASVPLVDPSAASVTKRFYRLAIEP